MKKHYYQLFVVAALFFAAACTDKTNTPEYVTEAFLKSFTALKFEECKKYSSSETQEILAMMASITAMSDGTDKMKPEPWKPLTMLKCKVSKDTTAICNCKNSDAQEPSEINLVKRKGKWLVKMTKDDIQNAP